jgi:hypothetical protein
MAAISELGEGDKFMAYLRTLTPFQREMQFEQIRSEYCTLCGYQVPEHDCYCRRDD